MPSSIIHALCIKRQYDIQVHVKTETDSILPIDLSVFVTCFALRPFEEVDLVQTKACKSVLKHMFRETFELLDFKETADAYVLNEPLLDVFQAKIDSKISRLSKVQVKIPFVRISKTFTGTSKDWVEYGARAIVDYQPKPQTETHSISQYLVASEPDTGSGDAEKILDQTVHAFNTVWKNGSFSDYIRTIRANSGTDDNIFKRKHIKHLAIHDHHGTPVFQSQCWLTSDTEARVTHMYRIQFLKNETLFLWLFFCFFGTVGMFVYKFFLVQMLRHLGLTKADASFEAFGLKVSRVFAVFGSIVMGMIVWIIGACILLPIQGLCGFSHTDLYFVSRLLLVPVVGPIALVIMI